MIIMWQTAFYTEAVSIDHAPQRRYQARTKKGLQVVLSHCSGM